jgi:hypothetical protein
VALGKVEHHAVVFDIVFSQVLLHVLLLLLVEVINHMLKFVCLWLNQLLSQLNPLLFRERLQELLRSDVVRDR